MDQVKLIAAATYALVGVLLVVFVSTYKNRSKLRTERAAISPKKAKIRLAVFLVSTILNVYLMEQKVITEQVGAIVFMVVAILLSLFR